MVDEGGSVLCVVDDVDVFAMEVLGLVIDGDAVDVVSKVDDSLVTALEDLETDEVGGSGVDVIAAFVVVIDVVWLTAVVVGPTNK